MDPVVVLHFFAGGGPVSSAFYTQIVLPGMCSHSQAVGSWQEAVRTARANTLVFGKWKIRGFSSTGCMFPILHSIIRTMRAIQVPKAVRR